MTTTTADKDEIARVAHAIWESEGRPEGRDHDHWMRAVRIVEEGRGETEYPSAAEADADAPRPVQPGFEDAAPGTVPQVTEDPVPDLDEGPGGRFARQLDEAPEEKPESSFARAAARR
jgi:hypothetical protein